MNGKYHAAMSALPLEQCPDRLVREVMSCYAGEHSGNTMESRMRRGTEQRFTGILCLVTVLVMIIFSGWAHSLDPIPQPAERIGINTVYLTGQLSDSLAAVCTYERSE